jgi:hypothetical protein
MSYTLISAAAAPNNTTNAQFQAWGSTISNAISNSGWLIATGVGTQINWATVAAPGASNTAQGYEIWKMNDSLQGTAPIYLKIEYGSGGASAGPGLWVTLGNGANATGNITGNTSQRYAFYSTATSATTYPSNFSGANNRFAMNLFTGSPNNIGLIFGVERTLDANGTPTATGLLIFGGFGSTHNQVTWTPTTGNTTVWETSWGFLTPDVTFNTGLTMGVVGQQIAAYPCFFNYGPFFPPGSLFLCYFNGEFSTSGVLTMPFGNTTITYAPLGNTTLYAACARGGNKTCVMMRWD